jgi:hypothetical protein
MISRAVRDPAEAGAAPPRNGRDDRIGTDEPRNERSKLERGAEGRARG